MRQFEVDPWSAAPNNVSRLSGLNGSEKNKDPAWVFETDSLLFEPGPVSLTVKVDGFGDTFSFMFLELTNQALPPGSPGIRLQIVPMELHPGRDQSQHCEIAFTAHKGIAYKLSGHIHGDNPLHARSLTVYASQPAIPQSPGIEHPGRASGAFSQKSGVVRETGRIFDLTLPNFEKPYSQAMTAEQLKHPAFKRLQTEIFGNEGDMQTEYWPEVFALRVLEVFGSISDTCQSIGFDADDDQLWSTLLARKKSVIITNDKFDPSAIADLGQIRRDILSYHDISSEEENLFHYTMIGEALPPEYCKMFAFSWWIKRSSATWQTALRGLLNVAESLKPGGVGVAIFPIHYDYDEQPGIVSFRNGLPRIIIDAMSLGHRIVQARLTVPTTHEAVISTYFAIIVHNPVPDE